MLSIVLLNYLFILKSMVNPLIASITVDIEKVSSSGGILFFSMTKRVIVKMTRKFETSSVLMSVHLVAM